MFAEYDIARSARVYAALPELVARWELVGSQPGPAPRWLSLAPYELQAFSQNGEDGVIAEILRRTGVGARTFVEFGVESGREGNCVFLADVLEWRGLFMDADPGAHHLLAQKYGPTGRVRTLHLAVTPGNVESAFSELGVDLEPDVMCIDVDGEDLRIWRAIEAYRPRVVVIEYNAAIPPEERLVQPEDTGPWDGTAFGGASLGALIDVGAAKGYRLVHCEIAGVNAFFVREDLPGDFPAPEAVSRRGPNYFLTSYGHPADEHGRRYVPFEADRAR